MPERSVQPGDRYLRDGNPSSLWVVVRVIDREGLPPHAVLAQEGSSRTITLAVSALADGQQFKRLGQKG
jgi:hypothetical protein